MALRFSGKKYLVFSEKMKNKKVPRNRGENSRIAGSFRDPSGFIFKKDGHVFRQINRCYKENYDHFISSGLYEELVRSNLLVSHEETDVSSALSEDAYKILRVQEIPFVSYPYEWCFEQLQDAALTTLEIQKKALKFGMVLKDASAFNIQFLDGGPIFIDTLSFEKYRENEPWIAYRQFCRHFIAPLSLVSYRDVRFIQFLRVFIDGIPLDLVSSLLPLSSWFNPASLLHIHFHSRMEERFSDRGVNKEKVKKGFSRNSFRGLIDSLNSLIKSYSWFPERTEWSDYYEGDSYTDPSFEHKKSIVDYFLKKLEPKKVWDLGANTGIFTRLASEKGAFTLSFDIDYSCVESHYRKIKKEKEKNILPLFLDLTNPSPGVGWKNEERESLIERGPADVALALALIHHLRLSNNVPLEEVAIFLKQICKSLIIEFVPKHDPKSQKLLAFKGDIFPDYNQDCFEKTFRKYFQIKEKKAIEGSKRILYLMIREDNEKNL